MARIAESLSIADVLWIRPQWFEDDRGRFCEAFRQEWFPQRAWDAVQCNRSESRPHVLRGLHYHCRQADYWQVLHGALRIGLVDLRASSATYLQGELREVDAASGVGVFIPPGVAHGFYSLTQATLWYVVDQYYDGQDERGVRWNDPALALEWGCAAPILSARDAANPLWRDVGTAHRPQ